MKIEGIIVPILTPMNVDESVNLQELRRQIDRLIHAGVHGIFPFGTNGEGYILSTKEKLAVLETCIDQVNGRVPVYAGTGCIATRDTIALSRKAAEKGADVLSVITPKIDRIIGVKDSSGNFDNLLQYIERTRGMDFTVLSGNDSLILWTLLAGGKGGIAGCANVFPENMVAIYEKFVSGDLEGARRAQDAIRPFRNCFRFGNPNTVVKTAVKLLGYPVGDCRAPFNGLSQEGVSALKSTLAELTAKGMR